MAECRGKRGKEVRGWAEAVTTAFNYKLVGNGVCRTHAVRIEFVFGMHRVDCLVISRC